MTTETKIQDRLATTAERLARIREEESLRAEIRRGGITASHRDALIARLTTLVGVQIEEEQREQEEAGPRVADLPPEIASMDPREATRRAEKIRADRRWFAHVDFANRREIDALREQAAFLDRRAMALPADVKKLSPEQARARSGELDEKLRSGAVFTPDERKEIELDLEYLERRSIGVSE